MPDLLCCAAVLAACRVAVAFLWDCRCFAAHDGHLVWPGIIGWGQVLHLPSSFFLWRCLFWAVAVELFTLWPLISALLVLEAFLYALLKFEWGWSAGWLLYPGGFFDSGYEGFAQKISFWPIFCSVHAQNCRLVRYGKWWSSPSEDASLVG